MLCGRSWGWSATVVVALSIEDSQARGSVPSEPFESELFMSSMESHYGQAMTEVSRQISNETVCDHKMIPFPQYPDRPSALSA